MLSGVHGRCMGGYGPGYRWRLSAEDRALGLACASALRPEWDLDTVAARIASVAGPAGIRAAIEDARRAGRRGPRLMSSRAEAALRRALEIREQTAAGGGS